MTAMYYGGYPPQTGMAMPPGMNMPMMHHYATAMTYQGIPAGYEAQYGMMPGTMPPGIGGGGEQISVQLPAGAIPPPQVQAALMNGQPLQQPKTELDPAAAALKAQRKLEKQKLNKLELFGNTNTMNLQRIIHMNIQASPYFKDLIRFKTYHEVVDEIYYQVSHLEPWVPGAGNTPSTAWCLLYKCFVQKLTRKQLDGMLKHSDSPYIRAIGFMYLRLTQDPKNLWSWFEPYLSDEEPITVKANEGRPTTIGRFVRELLTEQKFCDQLWPRIPVPVMKELEANLKDYDQARGIESEADEPRHSSRDRGSRSPRDGSKSRSASRSHSVDREDREKESDRGKDSNRDRDRERDRDRDRGRDSRRDRDRDRRDRDRDRDRRDRGRDRRDRRDRREDERERRERSPPSRKRSRSRSPTPTRRVKPAIDSAKRAAELAKLKEIYGSAESSAPSGTSLLKQGNSVTEQDTIKIGFRRN